MHSNIEKKTEAESYPLEVLDHDHVEEAPSSSSDFYIPVDHGSFEVENDDHEHEHNEPLLPTTTNHLTQEKRTQEQHPTSLLSTLFSFSILSRLSAWIQGPSQPHKYQITPLLERWQTAPCRAIDRYLPDRKRKIWFLLAALGVWGVVFVAVVHASVVGAAEVVTLACRSRLWNNATDCGLNGDSCRPFDNEAFAFRCPARCKDAILLEPYAIGAELVNYRSLIVGGGDSGNPIYRGDSYICPAAIHAGIISDQKGGCGILRRTGEQSNYESAERNGVSSIEFPSSFPLSFTFDGGEEEEEEGLKCSDARWPLFGFSVAVTALLSLCIASPAAFYTSMFFIVFFQVALVSDSPYALDYYEIVSMALGRFLPAAFVGFTMYYFCVRRTLTSLDAHWDKTVLWLGGCWVGALETDTFDRIPISRLTPHDIQQQPGALVSLIIIIAVLCLITITQAIAFRNEGRLPTLLRIYGVIVLAILALLAVPHMLLRLHHYILGLIFIPGTTLQTRPSLLYQGLCVGLFINGIARWDFDSILQTPSALLQGAQLGSIVPQLATPLILSNRSLVFDFFSAQLAPQADGISVLVNDVERFRGFKDVDRLHGGGGDNETGNGTAVGVVDSFNWTRRRDGEPEFFRFGYVKVNALGGVWYEDFTDPAVWEVDGTWKWSESGNQSVSVKT